MDFVAETIADLSPSLTLSITSQAKKMREEGIDVCSFGAGEPDFDTLDHIKEACIDANLHIHLDKPAGADLGQFRRIMKKADAKKRTVQMGYMYRYNPAFALLRELLNRGWLGEIFELHTVMSKVVGAGARRTPNSGG